MKLTVGPLPPAVYWRRRAIVLGGLLLVILLIVYACGPKASNAGRPRNDGVTPSSKATASASSSSAAPLVPIGPSTSASADTAPSTTSAPPAPTPSTAPSTLGAACADSEVLVTTSIAPTSPTAGKLQFGGTFVLKLQIQNTSKRTCTRDVGSVPEELMIKSGAVLIWSSGACSSGGGIAHDVRTFHPGDAVSVTIDWSSYDITTRDCDNGTKPAAVGTYQLIGQVGSKISSPTTFKIQY
jgi:hypothetical protein